MAKRISEEDIRLNIIVNGDPAQKEILDLEKSTKDLTAANRDLKKQRDKLIASGQKESEEYKRLTREINTNSATIKKNNNRVEELEKTIGVTGLTMTQLTARAKMLRTTLANMVPGKGNYDKLNAELREINARLTEMRGKATATSLSMGKVADGFNRYAALGASVIATGTGVVLSLQKIIDINAQLSDAQSDVRKTTGLTKNEVDELTKSFGLMKTRTARIELLGLATEAGRLGIEGVENVKAFVEQANKMKVALGDDLSDEAIREVGKMVNVYKVGEATGKDFAGAMDALGSSINEVSASGANQAGFLVDYLKRQAGIAAQTKLSAADNVGYAATFDEIGQSVEVSATAMNKVWMDMFTQPQEFAKIAGVSLNEFNRLLKEDANEAMLLFLEGLNGNKAGLDAMLSRMEDLEVGGARGVQALAALASNTDLLRKRQDIANQSLNQATSLTDEYNLKNNNLAATLEKVQKRVIGFFSSETVVNWLTSGVEWFAKFIGATEDADESVEGFRNKLIAFLKVLLILTSAYVSYQTALKLTVLWTKSASKATALHTTIQKIDAGATRTLSAVKLLLAAAYFTLTGNTQKATVAMRAFNIVSKMNPFGILLAAITAVGVALWAFKKNAKDAKDEIKQLASASEVSAEITKKAASDHAKATAELKTKIEPLLKVLEDENMHQRTRKKAYEELIKIAPQFRDTVDKEYKATDKLRSTYDKLVESMKARTLAQANEKIMQKYADAQGKAIDDLINAEMRLTEAKQKRIDFENDPKNAKHSRGYQMRTGLAKLIVEESRAIKENREAKEKLAVAESNWNKAIDYRTAKIRELEALQKEHKKGSEKWLELQAQIDALLVTSPSTEPNAGVPTFTPTGDPKKTNEDLRKAKEDQLKLEREYEDAILALMDEGFAKERQKLETEHTRKIEDLENRMVAETEIQKALANSRNDQLTQQERTYWAQQAAFWIDNNKHVNGLIELELDNHENRKGTLREEWRTKEIQEQQKSFEKESIVRQTKHNEELAALGNNEVAKKVLKEKFEKEELDRNQAFLQKLIDESNDKLSELNKSYNHVFLTEEQRAQIESEAQELKLKISELLLEKSKLQGGADDDVQSAMQSVFGDTDILGFSANQWADTFNNIENLKDRLQATRMTVRGLQNLWGRLAEYQTANENAQLKRYTDNLDARKYRLKMQLDDNVISQASYNRKVERLERDLDHKKFQLEYDQAKRKKKMAYIDALINVAQGVTAALSQAPPASYIMAAITAVAGAAEIATIAKQPLPARGYEEGYYPEYVKREQDGKLFKSTFGGTTRSGVVNKPTHFLTGENGPEMIIDNRAFREMNPGLRDALIRELRGIKGFEGGYYNKDVLTIPNTSSNTVNSSASFDNNQHIMLMTKAIDNNNKLIEELIKKGVIAIVSNRDLRSMGYLKDGIEDYETLRNNSKR